MQQSLKELLSLFFTVNLLIACGESKDLERPSKALLNQTDDRDASHRLLQDFHPVARTHDDPEPILSKNPPELACPAETKETEACSESAEKKIP